MQKLMLITGGARSGKSDYALHYAESLPGPHFFLATCPVVDKEMEERIKRHRNQRRNRSWQTIEEEIALDKQIRALPSDGVCLIDCLTLWVNNIMYRAEKSNLLFSERSLQPHIDALLFAVSEFQGTCICVTNEVGMGVVPDNVAARKYRDCVGRCNRAIADAADEVVLVSCGLPLFLKKQMNR